MTQDQVTITISGKDQNELVQKGNAIGVLAQNLDGETLKKLAYVVTHQPNKVKLAKKALGLR